LGHTNRHQVIVDKDLQRVTRGFGPEGDYGIGGTSLNRECLYNHTCTNPFADECNLHPMVSCGQLQVVRNGAILRIAQELFSIHEYIRRSHIRRSVREAYEGWTLSRGGGGEHLDAK